MMLVKFGFILGQNSCIQNSFYLFVSCPKPTTSFIELPEIKKDTVKIVNDLALRLMINQFIVHVKAIVHGNLWKLSSLV